jgi:hypothetical protein
MPVLLRLLAGLGPANTEFQQNSKPNRIRSFESLGKITGLLRVVGLLIWGGHQTIVK